MIFLFFVARFQMPLIPPIRLPSVSERDGKTGVERVAEIPFFDNASHFRAISKKWSVEWGRNEEVGSVPQFRAGVRVPVYEWVKGMYFCLVLCVHHRNEKLFGWAVGLGGCERKFRAWELFELSEKCFLHVNGFMLTTVWGAEGGESTRETLQHWTRAWLLPGGGDTSAFTFIFQKHEEENFSVLVAFLLACLAVRMLGKVIWQESKLGRISRPRKGGAWCEMAGGGGTSGKLHALLTSMFYYF